MPFNYLSKTIYKYKLEKIKSKLESQIILDSTIRNPDILIGWSYENIKYFVLDNKSYVNDVVLHVQKYTLPKMNFVFIIIDPFDYDIHSVLNTMRHKAKHERENTIRIFLLSTKNKFDVSKIPEETVVEEQTYYWEYYSINGV